MHYYSNLFSKTSLYLSPFRQQLFFIIIPLRSLKILKDLSPQSSKISSHCDCQVALMICFVHLKKKKKKNFYFLFVFFFSVLSFGLYNYFICVTMSSPNSTMVNHLRMSFTSDYICILFSLSAWKYRPDKSDWSIFADTSESSNSTALNTCKISTNMINE